MAYTGNNMRKPSPSPDPKDKNKEVCLICTAEKKILTIYYWMRLSMMWRIMQIKENVMTASKIRIILHIILKPNWIMLKFLTSLTPLRLSLQNFGLFLSMVLGYKQMFFSCRYWYSSLVDNIHHWSSIMFCVFLHSLRSLQWRNILKR